MEGPYTVWRPMKRKKWADGEDFEEMISMFKQGSI
jgi:hypothetical protein